MIPPPDASRCARMRRLGRLALSGGLWLSAAGITFAQALPPALPEVFTPPVGDPRLEPIPDGPVHLVDFDVFASGKVVTMRFPPRVNGQAQSDGDKHADLYVLFYADTGLRVDQPFILEAVPKNAAGPGVEIDDLTARMFSPVWELLAVTVAPTYDPNDPFNRIDSVTKVFNSPFVQKIFQTNIFLNCPVVPVGSTVAPGSPPIEEAFFDGHIVHIVPYDIEDGGFNPQVMFMFEDADGNVLGAPHLVASFAPGEPFYSSIWEIWKVHVPNGFDVSNLRSASDVKALGFPITSTNIRLNCPAVAVDGVPIPFDDAFAMLENDGGTFNPNKPLHFDVPETEFTKPRTFLLTEIDLPGVREPNEVPPAPNQAFPRIDPAFKGNVIPLILVDPFQTVSSGPNTAGPFIRIDQAELDAAFANNDPPLLPAAIEANFTALVQADLLDPEWLPGNRAYIDRLALVGRAFHELVWTPEQGANQKDVTSCAACHGSPTSGAASRGLYTLERATERPDFGPPELTVKLNAGSMWGSGAAELLIAQKKARGEDVTFAHGSLGQIPSIRAVISGARNAHFGIQSTEFIAGQTGASLADAATIDLDGDGVVNESTVGEVTAEAAFLLSLPVPNEARDPAILEVLGLTADVLDRGRVLFRRPISEGGAGCAACHTVFHPLDGLEFVLSNPETPAEIRFNVPHHFADLDDALDGLASFVGQPGLRTYGDFQLHKMGARMRSAGQFGTDVIKTAELWDVGSVFPYLRDGTMGSDLEAVILAHEGAILGGVTITCGPQVDSIGGAGSVSTHTVTLTNATPDPIPASIDEPIRLILVGALPAGLEAINADGHTPGSSPQGAFWLITDPLAAGASLDLELRYKNPNGAALPCALVVQDHAGFSEGVAAARAFSELPADSRADIIGFLRAQLIQGKVAEGSGGAPPGCGNFVLDPGEQCDDGNNQGGDCCSDACQFEAVGSPCEDGNPCTVNDQCATEGRCLAGPEGSCDDGNPCTTDGCGFATGCVHDPAPHAGDFCDDGNACTANEVCDPSGACSGAPVDCDDGNPCTNDGCDRTSGCVHVANGNPCDDGDPCTVGDTCSAGACVSGTFVDCDDGNPCTDDACDGAGGCIHTPNALSCDDGNACTVGDVCSDGVCVSGAAANCDDGNVCTDDSCDPASGCVNAPNALSCDDGDVCTQGDACQGGVCTGSPVPAACGNGCVEAGEQCGEPGLGCALGEFCDTCACVTQDCAFVLLETDDALPGPGLPVAVDLLIDSGAMPLGAYTMDFAWDPAVLTLDDVVAGTTPEFSSADPTCSIDPAAGSASCTGLQATSDSGPLGASHVATLQFTVVDNSNAFTDVTVTPENVFDTNGDPIPPCNASDTETVMGKCGDLNASATVTITDALLAAQFQVGSKTCSEIPYFELCDIAPSTRDQKCTIGDALRMAQCSVGLVPCDFTCSPLPPCP